MKLHIPLFLVICLIGASPAQAASGQPQLSAGHEKMLEWCGQAIITGKTFTTSIGPGGEIKGTWIGKPILGGFAIEGDYVYEGQGPNGETRGKEIVSYDPKTDKYTYTFLTDNGYCETAPFTQEGAVAAWQTPCIRDGKQYQLRGTDTDLSDGTGFVRREEISADGQTWLPLHESRFVFAETTSTSEEQELIRLETEAWKAATKSDFNTMDRILADEFVGIYGADDDPIWTKAFLFSVLKSRRYVLTSIEYEDLKVRVDGRVGVVNGTTTTKETFDGEDISGRFRFASAWIKGPAGWQCTSDRAVGIAGPAADGAADGLEGVWERKEQKMDGVVQETANLRGVKTYQDGTWQVVFYDATTGKVETILGGPYTFDGETLKETIGFVNVDEGLAYIGQTLIYDIEFRDGRFYQSGDLLGQKLEEIWAPASSTP
jgi:hypothetical protein